MLRYGSEEIEEEIQERSRNKAQSKRDPSGHTEELFVTERQGKEGRFSRSFPQGVGACLRALIEYPVCLCFENDTQINIHDSSPVDRISSTLECVWIF